MAIAIGHLSRIEAVGAHFHAEAFSYPAHHAADMAVADDAEGAAAELEDGCKRQRVIGAAAPGAFLHGFVVQSYVVA